MSNRVFHEYSQSVWDIIVFKEKLADKTLTQASSESAMTANQYYQLYDNYFTFKSDGTKKCGLLFDLNKKIKHGDLVKASVEMMIVEGEKPSIIYSEGATKYVLNKPEGKGGFEVVTGETYLSDRTGIKEGNVFIGLEEGQSGTFRIRFPHVKHFAQAEYTGDNVQRNTKMYQLTKSNGTWAIDTSNSFRRLDPGRILQATNTLSIGFTKPFIQDVPQVFVMTNNTMAGYTVHFGYRVKESVDLTVYDATGTQVAWNSLPDNSSFNLLLVAGLYY